MVQCHSSRLSSALTSERILFGGKIKGVAADCQPNGTRRQVNCNSP
ncbi:hypothetical protein ACVWW1_006902 [Bradyrhizobium sp. JR3.5]